MKGLVFAFDWLLKMIVGILTSLTKSEYVYEKSVLLNLSQLTYINQTSLGIH